MSLDVQAVEIDDQGKRRPIAPSKPAGFERWRTDVWGSRAVIVRAQAVRRPRPSRMILPSLAAQDILVEGDELDQLEREVDAVLADAVEVVREIEGSGRPMIEAMVAGVPIGHIEGTTGKKHALAPSEPETLEHFRRRLRNIKEAVQLARTVPRGGVEIS